MASDVLAVDPLPDVAAAPLGAAATGGVKLDSPI